MTMETTMTYSCNKAPPYISGGAFIYLLNLGGSADRAHRPEVERIV